MFTARSWRYPILALAILAAAIVLTTLFYGGVKGTELLHRAPTSQEQASWATYNTPFFSVLFPVAPSSEPIATSSSDSYPFTTATAYTSTGTSTTFLVLTGVFASSTDVSNPDALFRSSVGNVLAQAGNRISTTSTMTFDGNHALKISYFDSNDGQNIEGIYIFWDGGPYGAPSRYYQLGEITYPNTVDSSNWDRFINSFKIIAP
jgi:hypothetical protein